MAIVIKVSDLLKRAQELSNDGITEVELDILDEDDNDGDPIPPSLWITAHDPMKMLDGIDYDDIPGRYPNS